MTTNQDEMRKQIKHNITNMIEQSHFQTAQALLKDYLKIAPDDVDAYSMQSVIAVAAGRLDDAESILLQGLDRDQDCFDLSYNLGWVYEQKQAYEQASRIYGKIRSANCSQEQQSLLQEAFARIKEQHVDISVQVNQLKLAFFVKQGMDSFLGDIIEALDDDYDVQKIVVTELSQIDRGMDWADICWFEWCDELVVYGSKIKIAKRKKIICRLHSYEAFSNYPIQVEWSNIDKVIFIAKHIRDIVLKKINFLKIDKTIVIPNGINLSKYSFAKRTIGFKIAYVGYINYKKGPMLLLQTFKAIFDYDKRYKLYIAGSFQDERDVLYFKQMIREMGLENNIQFDGWQDDIDKWLEDKQYLISTSILEGHPIGIMEAMAKGIKPLIHNFVGAKNIYPLQYIWTTIDQCVAGAKSKQYSSSEYRIFIENNYSLQKQVKSIKQLLKNCV